MKTKALLFFLTFAPLWAHAIARVEADSLITKGTRAYAEGDHRTALVFFDSVATTYASASLFYNIGNCHYKLNDVPHAILFYERALRLAPGDADVRANLELARQSVVDRVNELPLFTLGSTWSELRGGRDADQWARRSLWAGLLFFVLLSAAVILRGAWRKILYGFSAIALFGTILSIGFASYRHQEVTSTDAAIIMAPKVDVRSEPSNSSTVLFVLHKGTKVTVLQQSNDWSEVKLSNGNLGWMPPSSLERI